MLLSLIFSVITRKKSLIFWCLFAITTCNSVFFSSSMQKQYLLQKYTNIIPKFSNNDIFIVAQDNTDILHPKTFSFPYKENISNHSDVLTISELIVSEETFSKTVNDPEILVISLKEKASIKKWIDTFNTKGEYIAVHSSQFKHLYNKAVLARNEALYTHFSLLSIISIIGFIGIIVFTAVLPIKLYKEMMTFLLEGVDFIKSTVCFGFCISGISIIPPLLLLFISVFIFSEVDILLKLFLQSTSACSLTAFFISAATLFFGRRNYVKNRIL